MCPRDVKRASSAFSLVKFSRESLLTRRTPTCSTTRQLEGSEDHNLYHQSISSAIDASKQENPLALKARKNQYKSLDYKREDALK